MPTASSPSPHEPGAAAHLPLDSRSLGRPVHLLPQFAERLRVSLEALLRQQLNRRYRAGYEVGAISITAQADELPAGRWCVSGPAPQRLACLVERSLVLSVMARRYGSDGSAKSATPELPPRETATEDRALMLLARQVLTETLQLMAAPTVLDNELLLQTQPGLAAHCCLIRVPVIEPGEALQSDIWLALEPAWLDRLLQVLAVPRHATGASPAAAPDLSRQLSVTLQARLLEQTLQLGDLLGLRPGDVIPVRLKATDVLVDGARLFTASVAEHQGKLCLTSFADTE